MLQRLGVFLTRTPPVVLFQYSLYVFSIGLILLSVHVKKTSKIRDFHADKVNTIPSIILILLQDPIP